MAGLSEQQLVNHLLFHKAMITEGRENDRLNEYIRLVKERGQGQHVAIEDPFDRSISLAFELVLDQGMDPWSIDLVKFTGLYMARVREGAQIDLLTAGKLLHMAWSILRMQSEHLRERAEPPPPPPEPEMGWDDITDLSELPSDVDAAYNQRVLGADPDDLLDEKVRHKGDRKVTLMELVSALEEARREAELRTAMAESREALKTQRRAAGRGRAQNAAHKEDQDADIKEVWERILGRNGIPIPITDIQAKSREDVVKTLVSVLFLAREQKIRVWQEDFPYGMIFIQNPSAHGYVDQAPATPETPTLPVKARKPPVRKAKVELTHGNN
ncbi:MAG: segregation and condensation protein [Thermoplasmata archaeon]|jgi:segregation and condensation protein A|nr:segregation and condensation protein [Thermoplasmata archaeon]